MPLNFKAAWNTLWNGAGASVPSVIDTSPDVIRSTPVARFESSYQYWGKRGYVPGSLQDARFDQDPSTRRELQRRSRHWTQNSGYLQRILDLFEEFTVGSNGLHIVPSTSNAKWNDAASAWWKAWCEEPARDNFQTMGYLQSLMARCWFVDGEIFVAKTYDSKTGRPAIQLLESNRVETPWSNALTEGKGIVDGVEIDEAGKPVAYQVRETESAAAYGYQMQVPGGQPGVVKQYSYRRVRQQDMFHLFEPDRPGLTRGIPMASAVLNDVQDLYELQDLSMQKARDAARITNVMTTKTGEADVSNDFKRRMQLQTIDANGNPRVKTIPQFYEITMGGETVYVMNGEKFEQFRDTQPSVTTQEYWNTLLGKMCIGVGIPRVLVVPYQMQGTVLRADIETAAAYFRARSAIVAHTMHLIYQWAIGWAKDYDRSLRGAPSDWADIVVRPPRSLSVDLGYATDALITQMDHGLTTQAEACAEMGKDWKQVQHQRGKEWKNAQEEADSNEVPVERIMRPPDPPKVPAPPGQPFSAEPPKASNNGNGHARIEFSDGARKVLA
jgi:capsid protein